MLGPEYLKEVDMAKGVFSNPIERGKKISAAKQLRKKQLGYINSPETREKMSQAKLGKRGEETNHFGKKHSDASKEKMSKATKSRKPNRLGKTHSEASKEKISIARKNKAVGKNNGNYKNGEYTAENQKNSWHNIKSFEYRQWRKAVYERDEYTCKGCGQVGGYLTAHHIKSWAKYPELRFNVDNGITLCEECHKVSDNYKGRGRKI